MILSVCLITYILTIVNIEVDYALILLHTYYIDIR